MNVCNSAAACQSLLDQSKQQYTYNIDEFYLKIFQRSSSSWISCFIQRVLNSGVLSFTGTISQLSQSTQQSPSSLSAILILSLLLPPGTLTLPINPQPGLKPQSHRQHPQTNFPSYQLSSHPVCFLEQPQTSSYYTGKTPHLFSTRRKYKSSSAA